MNKRGLSGSPLFIINSNDNPKNDKETNTITQKKSESLEDSIFSSVLRIGKIAATYRFSESEKKELQKIIFSLRMKDILISENILIRIAIKNLLYDYKKRSNKSVLHRIAVRLNKFSQ